MTWNNMTPESRSSLLLLALAKCAADLSLQNNEDISRIVYRILAETLTHNDWTDQYALQKEVYTYLGEGSGLDAYFINFLMNWEPLY